MDFWLLGDSNNQSEGQNPNLIGLGLDKQWPLCIPLGVFTW
jgi:hypothetical protein